MSSSNEEEKKFEEAKKFVLHNCYEDAFYYHCEPEVTPFAINSFLWYPFFKDRYDYKAYYKYKDKRNKSPYKELKKQKNIKKFKFEDNILRRRYTKDKGCFISKDELTDDDKWREKTCIDLSGDVITSLKSTLKSELLGGLLDNWYNANKDNLKLINTNNNINDFGKKYKIDYLDNFNKNNELRIALINFCSVLGTPGNMMPVPEETNPGGQGENYFHKLKVYKDIFCSDKKTIKWQKKNRNRLRFLEESGYEFDYNGYNKFIEDFCFQDFCSKNDDGIYDPIFLFDGDSVYPRLTHSDIKKDPIDEFLNKWSDLFNFFTILIILRSVRIYCIEHDYTDRKKLIKKCIDKNLANVKEWYENKWENYDLTELF